MAVLMGYCFDSNGLPIAGANILIQGQTTGAFYMSWSYSTGQYIRLVADAEVYLVTPIKGGYTFAPTSQTVNVPAGTAQIIVPDFIGTVGGGLYFVQGSIFMNNVGLSGVVVQANTGQTGITDSFGQYTIAGLAPGTYTISPVSGVYTFTPTSRSATIVASDVFGIDFTASSATALYTISGNISDSTPTGISGVMVSINDDIQTAVYTDGNGNYSFTNVSPGTYIITPASTSGTFAPTTRSVTITTANSTGNNFVFTETGSTYSIAGTITNSVPAGIAGVLVTTDRGDTAMTNAAGVYVFWGLPNGTYRVTPILAGYTFTPTYLNVTISGADVSGKNFTGATSATTYGISGTITIGGSPLENVVVTAGTSVASTDANGDYALVGLANATTYTVTPTLSGYTFTPSTRSVTVNGANVTGQDFTAAATGTTYTISGHIETDAAVDLAGVLVYAGTVTAVTDSGGDYTLSGLSNGTYVVTPSLTGYLFSPSYINVEVSGANETGIDFVAYTDTPAEEDLPYTFANGDTFDADKINADFAFCVDQTRDIRNAQIADGAGIHASKIASCLTPPRGNLLADGQWIEGKFDELEALFNSTENYPFLPDAEDLEISGVGSSGSGGYIEIKAGSVVKIYGRTFTTVASQLPGGDELLSAESAYALRVGLSGSDLSWTLTPLYGKALGPSDERSNYALVLQVGTVTDGRRFIIQAPTGTQLLGARGVLISGDGAGQEFDITFHNGSTGLVILQEALTTAPAANDWVGLILDDPSAKDASGSLAGDSTPESGLAALVFTGEAGVQPRVMVQEMAGGTGRATLVELPWSDRLDINKGTGAASTQTIFFESKHKPVKRIFGKMLLYDERTADPARVSYQPIGAFSIPDAAPASPVAKGLNVELFPAKVIVRVSDGHFAILKDDGTYDTAKSARFKLWLEH